MKKILLYLSTIALALNCHATPGEWVHSALLSLGLKPKQPVSLSESVSKYSRIIGEYYDPETFEVIVPQTWSEYFDKLTLGDARRAVWAGIASGYNTVTTTASDAATWTSDTATVAAQNASYAHNNFLVPAWKNTCAATSETWSATKDFTGLVKDTGYSVGKFMYSHPQVTLAVGAIAALYYFGRSATGVVEEQYLRMQKFIDNTLAEVSQFDISAAHIEAERGILLSACDMYIPVTYLGQDSWYYRGETRAIDNFLNQVAILKGYMITHRDHSLILSQVNEVRDAAKVVQYILTKRLNIYAAQRILAKR